MERRGIAPKSQAESQKTGRLFVPALGACFIEFTGSNTVGVGFKKMFICLKISQENSKAEKSVYIPAQIRIVTSVC